MNYRDTTGYYGRVTTFLHNRLIAVWVIFELVFGAILGFLPHGNVKRQLFTLHKSLGIVIILTALFFLFWRLSNPKPQWPPAMPIWERVLARMTHVLLYVLMILMPLSGWVMSTAAGKAPDFFWLFSFPLPLVPASKALARLCSELHYIFAWALTAVLLLHISGALKHHFIDKNNILTRMWRA